MTLFFNPTERPVRDLGDCCESPHVNCAGDPPASSCEIAGRAYLVLISMRGKEPTQSIRYQDWAERSLASLGRDSERRACAPTDHARVVRVTAVRRNDVVLPWEIAHLGERA
jgi:hypothetical protein